MRHRHTHGVQVIGSRSKSDSQDSGFRRQQTGRGVLIRGTPCGRGYEVNLGEQAAQVRHANPLNIDCRGHCRNQRRLLCPNFGPAAAHLLHVSALPVHGTAATTLLKAHFHTRQTGHNRRGGGEQQKDSNDTGETAHDSV
jgi:hypothetical protein